MVTLNINIEGDGKGVTSPQQVANETGSVQSLPSPQSIQSTQTMDTSAPSPSLLDSTSDVGLSQESVPHPELTGISAASVVESSPSPEGFEANPTSGGNDIPAPSDTESKTTATPTKRKSRTTKSKTSGK